MPGRRWLSGGVSSVRANLDYQFISQRDNEYIIAPGKAFVAVNAITNNDDGPAWDAIERGFRRPRSRCEVQLMTDDSQSAQLIRDLHWGPASKPFSLTLLDRREMNSFRVEFARLVNIQFDFYATDGQMRATITVEAEGFGVIQPQVPYTDSGARARSLSNDFFGSPGEPMYVERVTTNPVPGKATYERQFQGEPPKPVAVAKSVAAKRKAERELILDGESDTNTTDRNDVAQRAAALDIERRKK